MMSGNSIASPLQPPAGAERATASSVVSASVSCSQQHHAWTPQQGPQRVRCAHTRRHRSSPSGSTCAACGGHQAHVLRPGAVPRPVHAAGGARQGQAGLRLIPSILAHGANTDTHALVAPQACKQQQQQQLEQRGRRKRLASSARKAVKVPNLPDGCCIAPFSRSRRFFVTSTKSSTACRLQPLARVMPPCVLLLPAVL